MNVGSIHYSTYGIVNQSTSKSSKVCYDISVGNLVWSFILMETIVAPFYFVGFSIFNPVRMKTGPDDQCTIDG